jgi:hypothetical protein
MAWNHPRVIDPEHPLVRRIRDICMAYPAYEHDERFYAPPYWGPGGWLAVDIDRPGTDWRELAEIIDTSYRQVALKRQIRALDN